MLGDKFDDGKLQWDLVPFEQLRQVVQVLSLGAKKYSRDNWQHVPKSKSRYFAAAMRHLTDWYSVESKDQETGMNHLAHAICCLLFLMWFEDKGELSE